MTLAAMHSFHWSYFHKAIKKGMHAGGGGFFFPSLPRVCPGATNDLVCATKMSGIVHIPNAPLAEPRTRRSLLASILMGFLPGGLAC